MPWLNDLWPLYTQTGFWLMISWPHALDQRAASF